MKEIDVSNCELVHAGRPWEHERQPCCKEMIPLLERKENYCSWFQPIGGTVDDQFPAMQIDRKYYMLSLRVQKAIFRHVRLRKGFVNREVVPDGRVKLRIPQPLLMEKRRTASRFTAMRSRNHGGGGVDPRETRSTSTSTQSVSTDTLVMQTIIPFFTAVSKQDAARQWAPEMIPNSIPNTDKLDTSLPRLTSFVFDEKESARNLVVQLQQDCPGVMSSRESFLKCMAEIYDKCHT